ncbi:MAG TPA: hypothetical protein VHC95_02160 [Opitutales bacterium]|nr:hypothetical protein [Opitutales bacterium]
MYKNFQLPEANPSEERTPGVAWLTVMMGGMLFLGNVAELGGIPWAAREWTAWLLAGLVLVHGVSIGFRWPATDETLRLPRWPLLALVLVAWLNYAWWQDDATPWVSRGNFTVIAEGWLLCWVVAATPGAKAMSWAWLMVLAAGATLALAAAVIHQSTHGGLWLPTGRKLPPEWLGRMSGTLPLPGAFGALMLLAGPPLLVLASVPRMPLVWRILAGSGGFAMLLGAILSFSLGAWFGAVVALGTLPLVVTERRWVRGMCWVVGLALMAAWVAFLFHIKTPRDPWYAPLIASEPSLGSTLMAAAHAWQTDPWLGGHGAPFTELARAADAPAPPGGWSYGFSDWTELAAKWGLFGLGVAGALMGGLLVAAWNAWSRLPRKLSVSIGGASTPAQIPEAKAILGAAAAGLSAYAVAMNATRTLNLPAMVFALAIMAGVLSRNIPQRGGNWRVEPGMRAALGVGLAACIAVLLVWKVALQASAREKLADARMLLQIADHQPDAELLLLARADLHEVIGTDPANVPAYCNLAWLELAQAQLSPGDAGVHGDQAEYFALRASNLAPRAPEPWVLRALACWLLNRPTDAQAYLDRAVELAPDDPQVNYYDQMWRIAKAHWPIYSALVELPPRYYATPSWPPLNGLAVEPENLSVRP